MTILDSILAATGTPDPEQQMEEWSRQQSARNRAAIDPNNPTGPPLSPATTTPPGQVPNNAKSDPDMGALIGQLARREQANQGFNQALGMGFGAFAQPRDRAAVDQMFNVAPLDATKLGASIMAANSAQQGQDRMNALLDFVNSDAGKQLAAANNINSRATPRPGDLESRRSRGAAKNSGNAVDDDERRHGYGRLAEGARRDGRGAQDLYDDDRH